MNLTQDEIKIIVNLLSQVSLPVNQAPVVLKIISKLQTPEGIVKKEEVKK